MQIMSATIAVSSISALMGTLTIYNSAELTTEIGKFVTPTAILRLWNFATLRSFIFARLWHITLKLSQFTKFKALFLAVAIHFR